MSAPCQPPGQSRTTLFACVHEYDRLLDQGLRLSGEDKRFFLVGRVNHLVSRLPASFSPRQILDYGCGIGDTTRYLAEVFPGAEVIGLDVVEEAVAYAQANNASQRVRFCLNRDLAPAGSAELCYVNGLLHHVEPGERLAVVRWLRCAIAPTGYLALFENNPWNPGTRLVMSRIPFDRDAKPLSARTARGILRSAGFSCAPARFLFLFPRRLAVLRRFESPLARLPLGAQYCLLASP